MFFPSAPLLDDRADPSSPQMKDIFFTGVVFLPFYQALMPVPFSILLYLQCFFCGAFPPRGFFFSPDKVLFYKVSFFPW